jgi:hypothetical protein
MIGNMFSLVEGCIYRCSFTRAVYAYQHNVFAFNNRQALVLYTLKQNEPFVVLFIEKYNYSVVTCILSCYGTGWLCAYTFSAHDAGLRAI